MMKLIVIMMIVIVVSVITLIVYAMVLSFRGIKPGGENVKENSFLCRMDNRCDK